MDGQLLVEHDYYNFKLAFQFGILEYDFEKEVKNNG